MLDPNAQGARCGLHPDLAAQGTCARCGTFVCGECGRYGENGNVMCAMCEPYAGPAIPWEDRHTLGVVPAFLETTKLVALHPRRFYAIPPRSKTPTAALVYGFVFVFVTSLLTSLYNFTLGAASVEQRLSKISATMDQAMPQFASTYVTVMKWASLGSVLCSPFQYLFNLVFVAGLTWVGLRITGNLRSSFSRIFSALAYASWINLLGVVLLPFADEVIVMAIGGFLMLVLAAVQWTIMVRESQRISTGQAVWTSLVMVGITTLGCCLILVPIIAFAVFAAAGASGH